MFFGEKFTKTIDTGAAREYNYPKPMTKNSSLRKGSHRERRTVGSRQKNAFEWASEGEPNGLCPIKRDGVDAP